jgi:hypothetical protein
MRTFLETGALTLLVVAVTILIGRVLTAALQIKLLKRTSPESLSWSMFLGTGFLAVAYGWGSYLGWPARWCLLLVGVVLSVLIGWTALRGRLKQILTLPRRWWLIGLVGLCLTPPLMSYFLSLLIGQTFLPYCDAAAYIGTAEWLQYHGFGTPAVQDPQHPVSAVIHSFQGLSHRMGPLHLLALLRAALPMYITPQLFPVAIGLGLLLNMAGVYVLGRWTLRLARFPAACGTMLIGTAYSSLCLSANYGFLCQIYGTASLAFTLALLSRLMSRVNWRGSSAVLAGLTLSTLVAMYSELSPVVAFASLCCIGFSAWRAGHRGYHWPLLRFVGLTLLASLLIGNYEWMRAVIGVTRMSQVKGVGWHIPWTDQQYALFATGFSPFGMFSFRAVGGVSHAVVTVVAIAALALGLFYLVRRRRTLPIAAAGLVILGLAYYFRFHVLDPWTDEVGQTWNLLKLAKWSFPLVAVLQIGGLTLVLKRLPARRVMMITLTVLALVVAAPTHWAQSCGIVGRVQNLTGSRSGLRDLAKLCHRLDELRPSNLYIATGQPGPWPRAAAGYLLYPRPIVSGWHGAKFFENRWLRDEKRQAIDTETLFVQPGEPPFEKPIEVLPYNYCIIDGSQPHILELDNVNRVEKWDGDGATWIGDKPCRLNVYSPRNQIVELSFETRPGSSRPETEHRTLRIKTADGSTRQWSFVASHNQTVKLPLIRVPAGVSHLELTCLDQPTVPKDKDGRVLLIGMRNARLKPVSDD